MLNPVTALEVYRFAAKSGTLILAGEGCYLKAFDAKTSLLLCQIKVFESQAIHGINVRQNDVLGNVDDGLEVAIWGGSCLTVFTREKFTKLLASEQDCSAKLTSSKTHHSCYSGNASDWILDGVISQHGECVLVTAHNAVLRVEIENESLTLETLSSPSRSILYSAHLVYESEDNILVAAGTVFGEIIVWRCSKDTISSGSQILHKFTGHEGSIFGVNISPVVVDWDGIPTRLLASCSDDRTIRIWEINIDGKYDGALPATITGRETGFGGNGNQGENCSECLAIVMGHASRIWSVQFLIRSSDITVLSFGEDATTQHWELENSLYRSSTSDPSFIPSSEKHAKLKHRNTFAFNSGKHIWSKVIILVDDGPPMLATGGADGKVSLYKAPGFGVTRSRSWDLWTILDVLPSNQISDTKPTMGISIDKKSERMESAESPSVAQQSKDLNAQPVIPSDNPAKMPKPKPKKSPKDAFNKYAFVSENQVLVTTTCGRVLLGDIGSSVKWTEVDMPARSQDLRSYSVIESISKSEIVFLGAANGTIFFYRFGTVKEFGKIQGKVADMFGMDDANVELLVTALGGSVATLFKVRAQELDLSSFESMHIQRVNLLDKFVVTSAGKVDGHLALGARNGSLAIYRPEQCDELVHSWSPSSPGDAVTTILNISNSMNDSKSGYFLTTSRNGTYSIFSLRRSITMVHQGSLPFGPMIEAAWFSGGDLILYGFKSKNFIVWNETQQYEISRVECGGAHRSYAYSPIAGSDAAGHFIYTKASRLYLHSQARPSHQIIKPGGHGREIKACAVSSGGLIATGAEDTALRIWRYRDGTSPVQKQFDCLAVVQKHTTGIQHLQWHGSSYLLSSGGNEEFFIWAVGLVPGFGIGLVCEASCPDQSEEQDLRIMSFDVSSLSVSDDGSETLLICLAYSDSTIRCYKYSIAEKFSLIAIDQYKSSCLMQLRHLKISHELVFLTAGTEGYLTVWRAELSCQTSKLVMLSNHRLHQSSIKALDILVKDNHIVVATGGDDNALGVTVYQADDLARKPRGIMVRSAHSAAITGLSLLSKYLSQDGEEMKIVTSSNDQRVKEWALRTGVDNALLDRLNQMSIRKVGDAFTSVADVSDLATLSTKEGDPRKVLVMGNGMEVYDVAL
jgi:hypothetical protein